VNRVTGAKRSRYMARTTNGLNMQVKLIHVLLGARLPPIQPNENH